MTFAQCKQKAERAIREGRDDDAREWLARANETRLAVAEDKPSFIWGRRFAAGWFS